MAQPALAGQAVSLCLRLGAFIADYHSSKEKEKYKTVYLQVEKAAKAYEKAELYSRTHGFRIFNATRGGKLEVFERVDFDSLF